MKDPVICKMALADDPEAYVAKLRHAFNEYNKNRILSNEYDVVTAMVLDQMAEDAEQCYNLLRKRFPLSGAVQSLSYVLAVILVTTSIVTSQNTSGHCCPEVFFVSHSSEYYKTAKQSSI